MEHYPGLKGNEILTHAATWMHHEENDWFLQIATTAKKKKKEMQEGKVIVWAGLTKSWGKRSERQGRKVKIYPTEWRVLENSKER